VATLRRATPADAEDLTRLRGVMHTAMGDELTDAWVTACVRAFRQRLATEQFAAFLIEVDGVAVSAGAGWLEEFLPSPYALDHRRGHIASMATDPEHRRQGHARLVFAALMDWFASQGIPRVGLRATEDGQALYESFGFRTLGGATMAWTAEGSRPGMRT
jgi:ribosomal protein S18 acetylase RimI-like enzyme